MRKPTPTRRSIGALLAPLIAALTPALSSAQDGDDPDRGLGSDTSQTSEWATGFDAAPLGPLDRWDSSCGRWRAAPGHAEFLAEHADRGAPCLHLLGGDDRQVTLELPSREALVLSFWAERWTARDPFGCWLEVEDDEGWRVLRDLSSEIRVGGFLSELRVPLPAGHRALRLRCRSPASSGLLIDDVRLATPRPMELRSFTTVQPVLPVLVGNTLNPIARVDLVVEGDLHPLELRELHFDLRGTTRPEDLRHVELFHGGARTRLDHRVPDEVFTEEDRFGARQPATEGTLRFEGQRVLNPGLNTFWLSVQAREDADLDGRIDAGCLELHLGDGRRLRPETSHPAPRLRLGVALRNPGDDGCACFRIPGLVTTPKGTLVAVYDVRWRGWGDLPGDIDVGLSRSTDGGRHWEPMQIIMDCGDDPRWRHDGVGDPSILVDRSNGRLHVLGVWSHGDRAWRGSGPGLSPEQTGQLMLSTSDDEGRSWSALRNLTAEVKEPEWCYLLQGPGRGITTGDGRLVFPAQFQASVEDGRLPFSTILHSGDHGATWSLGVGARPDTTESAVVELEDGRLMLNMRDNRGGSRAVSTSLDLGHSWNAHPSSRRALPEPVCMASLIHVGRELHGSPDGLLLFSNPRVPEGPRRNMTIQASTDHGRSWPEDGGLLLDEGTSAGYSCLSMIDEQTIGILYEGSRAHMTFQRVPLAEVLGRR